MTDALDIAVVGSGAAGLFAAVFAGRAARAQGRPLRITAFDGARTLGAKILVAGGGRCNVTHHHVDESAFAGSSRSAIRKVLLRFTADDTVAFFRDLGVELKREDTGKLFPVTDSARTVLDALLRAARDAGAELRHPWRVTRIERDGAGFVIVGGPGENSTSGPPEGEEFRIPARRVILATGGKSLPKSGSDGSGYAFARSLGHTITERVFPALVPLILDASSPLREVSGIATDATVEVRAASGKRLASFTNSLLCTHFGLSGPAALDVSRYLTDARSSDPGARLVINWLPAETPDSADAALRALGPSTPAKWLRERLPERLALALCAAAGVDAHVQGARLTRDQRKALVDAMTQMDVPVVGDRGYAYAEVTAGGVPLKEVRLETMESRVCPGLFLAGEVLDVDGRIGGFNFQWAWASGFVAGSAAAQTEPAQTKPVQPK